MSGDEHPNAAALLALAREKLESLISQMPVATHADLRRIAQAMAIAEREAHSPGGDPGSSGERSRHAFVVMAGLDPAIQGASAAVPMLRNHVDGRVEPGHDEWGNLGKGDNPVVGRPNAPAVDDDPVPVPKSRDGDGGASTQQRFTPLDRFARDLRQGAFETDVDGDRAARMLLWRLTIDRLRASNPEFLAANGFS